MDSTRVRSAFPKCDRLASNYTSLRPLRRLALTALDSTRASVRTGCHAIFTTDEDVCFSPEIFSRAGGDIYLAGLNTTAVPVPDLASEVQPDPASIEVLMRTARKLLGDDEVDVLGTGFCHRPVSRSGRPLLTRLTAQQTGVGLHGGVWASAGHGAWGISMSLGTGLVLAELILRHGPSADVSQLGLHA